MLFKYHIVRPFTVRGHDVPSRPGYKREGDSTVRGEELLRLFDFLLLSLAFHSLDRIEVVLD